jgi:hypothetical protein
MNVNTKKVCYIIGVILIVIAFGIFMRGYYSDRAESDGNDAINTVQQIERNNQSARDENTEANSLNESIGTELDAGQTDVSGATESVGRLQDSASERAGIISQAKDGLADSQLLIDEERSIFADIDRANKITTEQNSDTPSST